MVYKTVGIFIVIGVIVALISAVEYESHTTILPEEPSESTTSSLLEQYGGMLGLSGSIDLGGSQTISPDLYPQVVNSLPFQLELLNKKVYFVEEDTTVSVYTYFDEIYGPTFFGAIQKYTIGLPFQIKRWITAEDKGQTIPRGLDYEKTYELTEYQKEIVDKFRERITVSLDDETGAVTLTFKMPEPKASAEIGKYALSKLTEYLEEYKTSKAERNLAFIREQHKKAKQQFENAQIKLAEFRDQNKNLATAQAQTKEQRLQSEYDIAFNVYNSLAEQLEQAKIMVQEQIPGFKILNPILVPADESEPNRKMVVIVFAILGFLGAMGYILMRKPLSELRAEFE